MKNLHSFFTASIKITGVVIIMLALNSRINAQDPCVPVNLTASEITAHSAEVSWEGTEGQAWVRYAPEGDTNYEYRFTFCNHTHLFGLAENTEYLWEIDVFCNDEWTGYNTGATFTTPVDSVNCEPFNLTASDITAHSAKLSWEGTEGPAWVRYCPAGDTTYAYWFAFDNHVMLWWLAENTEYEWQLNVFCDGEWTGYNTGSTFTTLSDTISCEPYNLAATEITEHSAELDWEGTEGPVWVRYNFSGDTDYQYKFAHNRHTHLHNLVSGTEYEWALNVFCNGDWTGYNTGSTFTTLIDTIGCEPTNLAATDITAHSAELSWEGTEGPVWVRYNVTGDTNYLYKFAHNRHTHLNWLNDSTEYEWKLNVFCDGEWTGYNTGSFFMTLPDTTSQECIPTDLQAVNITETSAELSWTGGGLMTWVRYAPEGDTDYNYQLTFTNSAFLEELQPGTAYLWELNTNCGGGCWNWTGYIVSSVFTTAGDSVGGNITGIIRDNAPFSNVNLYPNPGTDHIYLSFVSSISGICIITVTDLSGRELTRIERQVAEGNNELLIDESALVRGNYLLNLNLGNSNNRMKWIKN
jgi:hypothetical protein